MGKDCFVEQVTCEIPDKKYIYFISAFPSGLKCNESCISIGFARRFGGQYTLFFIRILLFWPGLNFLIFLPILYCIILLKKRKKIIMMLFTVLFISFELSLYGTNVLHVSSIELLLALNIWLQLACLPYPLAMAVNKSPIACVQTGLYTGGQ